jgi:hypothetical protein
MLLYGVQDLERAKTACRNFLLVNSPGQFNADNNVLHWKRARPVGGWKSLLPKKAT